MNELTDQQLLRDYARNRSETAFAELVRRHIDLVHSAARRLVCDRLSAEDISQNVFVALAQNAARLTEHPVLSGWLHCTTRNLAAKTIRANVRRTAREQEAAAMNDLLAAGSDALWENIAPHLDTALGELAETDRDALMLRYFERKSAREMAQILGTSEEAAQKRLSRAIERLREFFSKRGIAIGAAGLVVVISANAVQAAPIGLAGAISASAVLAGAAIQTSTAITATKAIAMTTKQKVLVASIVVLVGAGAYEALHASQSRDQTHQPQLGSPVKQVAQLQLEQERPAAITPPPIQPPQPPVDNFLTFDAGQKTVSVTNGTPQAHFVFNVTNISAGDVMINGVQTSCGCTVAKLPSTPWKLAPKEGGQISATMNLAGTPPGGSKTKTLTVISDKGSKLLYVKAAIWADPPNVQSSLPPDHPLVTSAANPNDR